MLGFDLSPLFFLVSPFLPASLLMCHPSLSRPCLCGRVWSWKDGAVCPQFPFQNHRHTWSAFISRATGLLRTSFWLCGQTLGSCGSVFHFEVFSLFFVLCFSPASLANTCFCLRPGCPPGSPQPYPLSPPRSALFSQRRLLLWFHGCFPSVGTRTCQPGCRLPFASCYQYFSFLFNSLKSSSLSLHPCSCTSTVQPQSCILA